MSVDLTLTPATDPISIYRYRDGLYAVDLITAAVVELDFFRGLPATLQRSTRSAATSICGPGQPM